jgi:hypothetical protein
MFSSSPFFSFEVVGSSCRRGIAVPLLHLQMAARIRISAISKDRRQSLIKDEGLFKRPLRVCEFQVDAMSGGHCNPYANSYRNLRIDTKP